MGGPSPQQTAQQSEADVAKQYDQNFQNTAAYNNKVHAQQIAAAQALYAMLNGGNNSESAAVAAGPKPTATTVGSNFGGGTLPGTQVSQGMPQPPPQVPQPPPTGGNSSFPLFGRQLGNSQSMKV